MTSLLDLASLPVMTADTLHPLLGDVAAVTYGTAAGEYDRFNGQRMLTLTANTSGEDPGRVAAQVDQAITRAACRHACQPDNPPLDLLGGAGARQQVVTVARCGGPSE
jgi:multidrug efflux pump subunit AcrB